MKDASDKKILVDMLFWAVDNPAPANYLLISGDRDFSSALHQLRLRRYNILLAQPLQASAPLIAAARSVWLWTSLSAGGPPLPSGDLSNTAVGNLSFSSERVQNPLPEPIQPKYKAKYIKNNTNQPNISRISSLPVQVPESKNDHGPNVKHSQTKLFWKAPHEFFCNKPVIPTISSTPNLSSHQDHSKSNGCNFSGGISHDSHHSLLRQKNLHEQSMSGPDNILPAHHTCGFQPISPASDRPNFSAVPKLIPDIHKLNIHEYPNNVGSNSIVHQETREDSRISTSQSRNVVSLTAPTEHNQCGTQAFCYENVNQRHSRNSEHFRPSSSTFIPNASSSNAWGTKSLPPRSEYDQHLIGIILLTLDTLKVEKVMPTEGNITDCIRYGDPKYQSTNVRKALDCAIEHCIIVKQCLGSLHLYVGTNGKLWKCVNLIGGHPNDFPNATWARIQQFLASPSGRSSILASHCR